MANQKWNSSDQQNVTISGTYNGVATQNSANGTTSTVRALNGDTNTGTSRYFEYVVNTINNSDVPRIGISRSDTTINQYMGSQVGQIGYGPDGNVYFDAGGPTAIQTYSIGDVIAIAFKASNGHCWFKNLTTGSSWNNNGTADPSTDVGSINFSVSTAAAMPAWGAFAFNCQGTANWGDTAFTGTIPSGFSRYNSLATTGSLFCFPLLNGLSTGGPFFANPIG